MEKNLDVKSILKILVKAVKQNVTIVGKYSARIRIGTAFIVLQERSEISVIRRGACSIWKILKIARRFMSRIDRKLGMVIDPWGRVILVVRLEEENGKTRIKVWSRACSPYVPSSGTSRRR